LAKKSTSAGRVSQRELRRQEHVARQRKRSVIIGSLIGLFVVTLAVMVYLRFGQPDLEGVTRFGSQSRDHDQNAVIEMGPRPPVGGVHHPNWQNCGIYDQPVDPKYAIHSLEHGAVWLTYHPDLPDAEVAALRALAQGQSHVLMSPYPDQDRPVILTAWGLQMVVDELPDERIAQFIRRYQQGPQTPEPGASCRDGIGAPIG
jgi:hypothetical protein